MNRRVAILSTLAVLGLVAGPLRSAQAQTVARTLTADTTFFAEGIDADARTGALYVTSMRHRNVFVTGADGRLRPVIRAGDAGRDSAPPIGSAFGVAVDAARDLAWVATARTAFMAPAGGDSLVRAELLRVSLRDGHITGRWLLGDGTGMPGEIALAPDGSVLVSDGIKGALYRLRAGATSLDAVHDPALRSPQGIAVDPSGAVAWVADWSRGILRWDLRTDSLAAVPGPDDRPVRGVDGLRVWRGRLIGVQNGSAPPRVVELVLSADGRRIAAARVLDTPPAAGEPTVGAVVGDRYVYVSSGQWGHWSERGERNLTAGALPAVVVRELHLTP